MHGPAPDGLCNCVHSMAYENLRHLSKASHVWLRVRSLFYLQRMRHAHGGTDMCAAAGGPVRQVARDQLLAHCLLCIRVLFAIQLSAPHGE